MDYLTLDLGEVCDLHMGTVVEAPCPEIYIGSRRRPDPGPPTTRALAQMLASLPLKQAAE